MAEKTTGMTAQEMMQATMRDSEERSVIVAAFKDNTELLNDLRALFLGMPVSEGVKEKIAGLSPEIKEIIRIKLLPRLEDYRDGPVGVVADPWMGIDQDIWRMPKEVVYQVTEAHEKAIGFAQQALDLLRDPNLPGPDLTVKRSPTDEYQTALLARNKYIRLVNAQMHALWVIANQKDETPKETAKRLHKDSSQ